MTDQLRQQNSPQPAFDADTPELPPEDIELLTSGGSALQEALSADPDLMADVEQVIAEKLKRGITTTILGEIVRGLEVLIGPQAAEYLVRVAVRYDDPAYIDQVKAYAGPDVWRSIRRLLAVYGADLYEAFALAGEPLETWRGMTRFAYYDAVSGTWQLTIEITTYGGAKIRLTEAPDSLLTLMVGLAQTLNSVQADMAEGLIPESNVQTFFAECLQLVSLYAPSLAEEPMMEELDGNGGGSWWHRLLQRMTEPPSEYG